MTNATTGRWFLRTPLAESSARVFCIPYAGCGASMYRRWPETYRGVDLCRLQLPGRENRFTEPIMATYQELAQALADAVEPYLDVPYAFFGHCSSALAAYETSAEIERRGWRRPDRLFVSSQVAPQDGPVNRWFSLDRSELKDELDELTVAMGGTPIPDLTELFVDVLEADIAVNKRYVMPNPRRLATPITSIGWSQDIEVDHRLMGGWTACGDTRSVLLDGSHERFIEGPSELFETFAMGLQVLETKTG
ncbi:surfactin synthase thioesterase subunit [Catenulispora sp. GAS73]|uniref:thioesterase II family protein n=1 Tax=Catenulispora sp. GAS73 TaxID=3156269 RepID=UPI00351889AE